MNGGTDKIDTSYEELRTAIQQRLSTAKSREEYISKCIEILQEIAMRPDAEKFLNVYGDKKTFFYDLTPDLIKEARTKGKKGLEDCLNDDKTKISWKHRPFSFAATPRQDYLYRSPNRKLHYSSHPEKNLKVDVNRL